MEPHVSTKVVFKYRNRSCAEKLVLKVKRKTNLGVMIISLKKYEKVKSNNLEVIKMVQIIKHIVL